MVYEDKKGTCRAHNQLTHRHKRHMMTMQCTLARSHSIVPALVGRPINSISCNYRPITSPQHTGGALAALMFEHRAQRTNRGRNVIFLYVSPFSLFLLYSLSCGRDALNLGEFCSVLAFGDAMRSLNRPNSPLPLPVHSVAPGVDRFHLKE